VSRRLTAQSRTSSAWVSPKGSATADHPSGGPQRALRPPITPSGAPQRAPRPPITRLGLPRGLHDRRSPVWGSPGGSTTADCGGTSRRSSRDSETTSQRAAVRHEFAWSAIVGETAELAALAVGTSKMAALRSVLALVMFEARGATLRPVPRLAAGDGPSTSIPTCWSGARGSHGHPRSEPLHRALASFGIWGAWSREPNPATIDA